MTEIIGGYYCEKLQHWVKVLKPTKNRHRPRIYNKRSFRMKGPERKKACEPATVEDSLKREIVGFLIRKKERRKI
ncbi:hypothetical protein KAX02_13515 [candidate division WOR-3 bacterium]|nr:hypothetical protein [candidate division WOR-3 bacterium]